MEKALANRLQHRHFLRPMCQLRVFGIFRNFVCLLLTGLAFSILLTTARAGDWTIVKHDGRDYVTTRNVAQFYGLGEVARVSNSLTLGSSGRVLRGAIGSNQLYINNLKFILSYPITEAHG